MRIRVSPVLLCGLLPAAGALADPAAAQTVGFTGAVANLCVLTVTTPGLLGMASSGSTLSSDETGGVPAVVAISATGTNPTIAFGAPAMTGPAATVGGATKQMSYTSAGGASQAWTSSGSTYVANRLLDTVTVHARATNSSGFTTGAYGITSTVTCQQ